MVDPLTTFAAAGNALQFVQLGIDLIGKTIDYSQGGGNNSFQALRDCVQRLSVSSAHLQRSMESNASQPLNPGPARALHRANLECLRVSQQFTAILDKLGLNRPHSLWSSVKLALKSHVDKPKVDALSRDLDHARANLMLSLMVYLHDQSTVDRQNTSEEMRVITEQALRATAESAAIRNDIASLSSSLSSLTIDDTTISLAFEDALRRCESYLANEVEALSKRLERLNDGLKALSEEVNQLLPTMTREIAARRSIMDSLWFARFNNRRDRISRAYSNTYQWIFRHKDSQVIVWDDFVQWLYSSRNPIYWVSGKPGSGKSTLIRELDEYIKNSQSLSTSGNDADFIMASFYFWYAGNNDERSMTGLLRTLIHQLLSQRLDIVDQVISASRWESSLYGPSHLHVWEEKELIQVLCRVLQCLGTSKRILLFIDGLDEQEGPDDQRQEVLDLISSVTQDNNVKACVASRPYNIFRDEFKECPQLRLEDLTKDDIRLYVRGKLGENPHFQRHLRRMPQLLRDITEEITTRAGGVFLWVRLVVRDLLRVLRDGGSTKHLFRELESIPLDLDDYFRRMFELVEKPYRKEASIILQTALCSSSEGNAKVDGASDFDFLLMHLYFIDQSEDLSFGANSYLCDVDFTHQEEAEDLLESLERMLTSRSMGLLEIGPSTLAPSRLGRLQAESPIEFLHRTVRDYFAGPAARDLLHQHTGGPFDAHMFQCNLMAVSLRNFVLHNQWLPTEYLAVKKFLLQITKRRDAEGPAFVLFEKMVELFNEHRSVVRQKLLKECPGIAFDIALNHWLQDRGNSISLSIHLGWKSYVKARLTTATIREQQGRPLLLCALPPYSWEWNLSDPDIICDLLTLGANPDTMVHDVFDIPIWVYILESIQFIKDIDYETCLRIAKLLIVHGIRTLVAETDLAHVAKQMLESLNLWDPFLLDPFPGPRQFVHRRFEKIRGSSAGENGDAEPLYSFLDVLQSLVRVTENSNPSFESFFY
ncbi:uncharacterized protein PV07_07630 [Cladophialophora immunda]|uniref:Uncharacterized protein n=1 Tax=Cladophialophora immunda TaxID=569365 RepID=A0A0D2CWC7_9EURO|nr:uncharacterized protein PV07_07630 [Cladophialophora immunda]KIW27934.1 hypothetical protein PV07_07630 [Cladophialophora immunda]OQV00957.1 NACHT domain-containing protein [Cladophialophora immunda]